MKTLTVPADLYLTPLAGLSREARPGAERLAGAGRRRGWLPRLEGPLRGELDVFADGVRWRPGRGPKRRGHVTFSLEWGAIAGADIITMYAEATPVKALLTILTNAGEQLDIAIPRHLQAELSQALGEYLTVPGPPSSY